MSDVIFLDVGCDRKIVRIAIGKRNYVYEGR
jgi:hypothetical protein